MDFENDTDRSGVSEGKSFVQVPDFMLSRRFQQLLIALLFLFSVLSSFGFMSIYRYAQYFYKGMQLTLPLSTKICLLLLQYSYVILFPLFGGIPLIVHIFLKKNQGFALLTLTQLLFMALGVLVSLFIIVSLYLPFVTHCGELK